VINEDWEGYAGRVKLIVPKGDITTKLDNGVNVFADFLGVYECSNGGGFSAAGSDLTTIKVNNKDSVSVGGSVDLANLECNNATSVYAAGCALTAKSIGDFFWLGVYFNNAEAGGVANFLNGTNATAEEVNDYMFSRGWLTEEEHLAGIEAWIAIYLASWTISLN